MTQEPVKQFLLEKNFKLGVNTPHIIFNYLDYLLWKNRGDNEYKNMNFDDFSFDFDICGALVSAEPFEEFH